MHRDNRHGEKRLLLLGFLMPVCVLMKSIPFVGASPWACALVDSLFLLHILHSSRRLPIGVTVCAVILMPLLDWLQGASAGCWVPFLMAGYGTVILLWRSGLRVSARAVLCSLLLYVWRVAGVTTGYVLLKDMTVIAALPNVVRNSWYLFVWYAATACLYGVCIRKRRFR